MCGIAGKISNAEVNINELWRAGDSIKHRGPDDKGIYLSPNKKIGFAHRRLSLIDLTHGGHQPMISRDNANIIVFNGEIYNFLELRQELKKLDQEFTTNSDTEVILNGYKIWGTRVFSKLKGMFAIAIFDTRENKVILARDRFGIKPLYFARQNNNFYFGSEIKAILAFDNFEKMIRMASVSSFLANRYVSRNNTMWQNVVKLGAGKFIEVNTENLALKETTYWQLDTTSNYNVSENSFDKFSYLFQHSLSEHLRGDVKIGAFLSGGFDSSALVCTMQTKLNYNTDAFSLGFNNWNQSETLYAQIVADHCGANLEKLMLDEIELDVLPKLMYHYDDPIADISILPTYFISKLASNHVKAVVSGEGADELLGGYWWQKPNSYSNTNPFIKLKTNLFGLTKAQVKQHYIGAMSMGLFDYSALRKIVSPEYHTTIEVDPFSHFDDLLHDDLSVLKQIQYLDIHTFMSELILTKVDRASMAHSLEVRVPFLDHELVEFLFALPESEYFKLGRQKMLLAKYLNDLVPEKILNRPKQGFVGPDKYYMNISLYERRLKNSELIKCGIINSKQLDILIHNKSHWKLWKLLVLETWWKVWV
jgi:asparagine synthase (glutamine-hydrolysing)